MTNASSILADLQTIMSGLEPNAIPLPEVTGVFKEFAAIRRLAGNAETLLLRRVNEAREWARAGYPTAEDWIAAQMGASVGEAKTRLDTADKLRGLGETKAAMRQGLVSPEQAGIVADAAHVNPDAERDLLACAGRESNKNLKDEAARRKAQGRGEDPEQKARRHRRERKARAWTDPDGKRHLHVEGPVAALAGFEARWERETARRFDAARKAGKREPREAYAFDALLAMTAGGAEGTPKRTDVQHLALIRVDLTALRRGQVCSEEVCEVAGLGPIAVSEALTLLGDSVLKLVIEDGVDVQNITHIGRGPNAVQKLALAWTSQQCSVLGCHRTHTEYDHRIDYADTHHTRVDETDNLCDFHHDLKSYRGWALVEGKGKREFVGPDDPRHPNNASTAAEPPPPEPATGTRVSTELAERAPRASEAARRSTPVVERSDQGDIFHLLV